MFGPDGDNPNERPGLEELYESATNASSLKHEAERRTAADVLRDMAMSAQNLGSALKRLRAEWASVPKPTRPTRAMVDGLTAKFRDDDARAQEARTKANGELDRLKALQAKHPDWDRLVEISELESLYAKGALPLPELQFGHPRERAEREAYRWFDNELRLLANSLKSRAAVWEHLQPWLAEQGIEPHVGAAALLYWLDQNCLTCHGTRWETVAGTNRQGATPCGACHGSGIASVPHGQDGRKVVNHLEQCLHRYKQNMKTRRKALASIPPIDRLSKRMQRGGEED